MPDLEISGLPEATTADGTVLVPCVQGGVTKKMTLAVVQDGIVPIMTASVTINDTQIKASPTTEVFELVAAPGSGKLISPIAVYVDADFAAGAYANEDMTDGYVTIVYDGPNEFMDAHLFAENGAFFANADARMYVFKGNVSTNSIGNAPIYLLKTNVVNRALQLYVASFIGNLTGGNAANTMKVTVVYTIIDV